MAFWTASTCSTERFCGIMERKVRMAEAKSFVAAAARARVQLCLSSGEAASKVFMSAEVTLGGRSPQPVRRAADKPTARSRIDAFIRIGQFGLLQTNEIPASQRAHRD